MKRGSPRPILWVIAGPNGAGKSSYYRREIAAGFNAPFINADVIAKARWPEAPEAHSYEAAQLADQQRQAALREGRSLVAETVFSHPSKLDLLRAGRAAGHEVWLSYINITDAAQSARRVADRVLRGGHNVPPGKIAERYGRVTKLMHQAVRLADRAWVLDNSRARDPFRIVMVWQGGEILQRRKPLPTWAKSLL